METDLEDDEDNAENNIELTKCGKGNLNEDEDEDRPRPLAVGGDEAL